MRNSLRRWERIIKEKRRSLRWIIGLALGVVAALTLFIFASITTVIIRDTLVEHSLTATQQSVNLSYLHMKNYHDELVQRASIIADEIQQVDGERRLEKMEEIYQLNQDVVSINLFDDAGALKLYSPKHYQPTENVTLHNREWLDGQPQRYRFLFSSPHLQDFYQTRPIWVVSLSQQVQVDGESRILVVDFDFKRVSDYFNRVVIDKKGYVYVTDRDGKVIYHPFPGRFSQEEEQSVRNILDRGDGIYVTPNEQYTVGYRTISYVGWRVIGISYLEDTLHPAMKQIYLYTFLIWMGMLVVIAFVSILVSKYIAKPITNMVETMERTEKGNLDNKIYESRFNEVRRLSHSYNSLLARITALMQQVKEEQAELRKSEMNVLQSQINPHFLYNTLDSILWMSERGDNKNTASMVSALGRLLRISLSKGENLIPIRRELAHAESYLTIQKIRYKNQFTYSLETDEGVLDYLTVKLIIQPFLENALYHGIERMVDEGHLTIRALDAGDRIRLEVEDDGVGIPPEELQRLRAGRQSSGNEGGIGLANVHQRIQIYFGEEYGVEVESELDEGTLVRVTFPKVNSV